MLTFRSDHFKKDLKKYDHHIADLRKQLASRYAGVEKVTTELSLSPCIHAYIQRHIHPSHMNNQCPGSYCKQTMFLYLMFLILGYSGWAKESSLW